MGDIYDVLAEKIGVSNSKHLPPIFEFATTPRQARILEALNPPPQPAQTAKELAQKLSLDEEDVAADLEDLFRKGLAFPRKFDDRSEWRYGKSIMQLHDAMLTGWRHYPDSQRLFDLWKTYDTNEGYPNYARAFEGIENAVMRIIPAWQSVTDNPNLKPWEDWREILRGRKLSVVDCPCRLEIAACDRPVGVCIDFERTAEYDVASGHGREITYEEALEIMRSSAASGLVHTAINSINVNLMCNCCNDCCIEFLTLKAVDIPFSRHYAKSRYEARINHENCDGCQNCIENCNFDALSMVKVAGSRKLKAQADPEACFGCGSCFMACDSNAISMECVRPATHVPGAE
ncbi:MAG: 4Fe-4S binding protein [Dehalococcoidia bacterium]|nr:4Fe-4S binding protein [Dehalococcoidia bacterium]